ncbi:MAG: SBBP repeat-containing protein, partial [Bacteroidota bacterium]|nr:SBBP repeat-containing protein [Bacteroidota bacterium]
MFYETVDFDPGPGNFDLVSVGMCDIFLSKLNNEGDFIWAKSIGTNAAEVGTGIKIDASGNIYGIGWGFGGGTTILKLNASGLEIWTKNMSVISATDIGIDATGNVYSAGSFFSGTIDFDPGPGTFNLTSAGSDDIWISKLNQSGNFVWAKNIGGSGHPEANSIVLDGSGNLYITGYTNGVVDFDPGPGTYNLTSTSASYDYDAFILKLDSLGNFLWVKSFGSNSYDIGRSIALDGLGNIYTTGSFNGTADFDPGPGIHYLSAASTGSADEDVFISKLDPNGNFLWAKNFGGYSGDYGTSVEVDLSGNVYATGHFRGLVDFDSGPGIFSLTSEDADVFILKLDSLGYFKWAVKMGGISADQGLS